MRREITAHTRDPIPEDRLIEMAADCGISLHAVRQEEVKWGYIPHRIVAHGEPEALHAFSQALTYSDLGVGHISLWDG
jgi:hypothetical protein